MNNDILYIYTIYNDLFIYFIYLSILFIYLYVSIPCAEEEIQVPGSRCKHDLGMKIGVMTFDWIASI